MRLRLVCAIAVMLPSAIEAMARMISMPDQCCTSGCSPSTRMRATNAKAASLGAEPISMVIAVGAPWYTSGTHMWNGTTPSLNARPETTNTRPNTSRSLSAAPDLIASDTAPSSSEPVAPYSMDMPYSSRPEASAPRMKYFIAASVATAESRCNATIAYRLSDSTSRPRYRVRKWLAEIITIMPSVANSASTMNSPLNRPRTVRYSLEYTSIIDTAR